MLFLFFEQRELFILAKRVKDFKVSIKKHINIIIKTQANYPNYILPPELSKRMINFQITKLRYTKPPSITFPFNLDGKFMW